MKLQKLISKFLLLFIWVQLLSQSYFAYTLVPSDISNQVFHYDAQNLDADGDLLTQPADNSRVSELLDLANSHTWSQVNINKQALFELNGLNNRPGLYFDGIDDLYVIEDHIDIASNDQYPEKSFAIVFQTSNDITSLQTLYEQWGQEKWYALQIDNGNLYVGAWNTIDWPTWEEFKIADLWEVSSNTTYNVIISQNSNTSNNLSVYLDGTLTKNIFNVSAQTTHGTCIISGAFSCYMFANGGSIGLGATKNDTLQLSNTTWQTWDEILHFQWHIWEVLSWNTALTPTDAFDLFWYFDDKWALKWVDIIFQNPGLTWVIEPWDFEAYITYNDYQNWNWIITTTDDLKLYNWDGSSWWTDIAWTFVDFWSKNISQFEAYYPITSITTWKYRLEFSITKKNWIISTHTRDFYVGELLPENIPETVFHYDAQDIDGDGNFNNNPADWSTIQILVDKFNWYNAIQNSWANRPVLENNTINTYPAISFNGTNQYFDIGNQVSINNRNTPPYTEKSFAAVFKTGNDVNRFQTIFEQGGNVRWYSFVIDQWNVYAWVWNTAEWDAWHEYKSVNLWPAQPNTTYFAMIVQDSQTNNDSLNTLKIYLNGNLASVQDHTDAQIRHPWAISIWRVNWNTVSASTNTVISSSGDFFEGKLWELISWNHAIDQADVNWVQEYFSKKWWIVLFSEKYTIPSPTSDTTPAYTFTTNRAWTLTYNGSCASTATNATLWENVINLASDTSGTPLINGSYSDCSITLIDSFWYSHVLNITPFSVVASSFTLTEVTAVPANGSNHFPEYTFSSPIEWTIEYSWDCSSNTNYANVWDNTITLNYLPDGYYENCYVRVINTPQESEFLLLSAFTIMSSAPSFTGSSIENNNLLPNGNFIYSLEYSDNAGINTDSRNIILQKYNAATLDWWNDISTAYFTELSVSSNQIQYNSSLNEYGKYRLQFSIENVHGTSSIHEVTFYIDAPEFIVNTSEIDLWLLNSWITNYSTPVEVQVHTVWANFNMLLKKETLMQYWVHTIQDYDGATWYGYQNSPYTWSLQVVTDIETIWSQSKNLNINWEKNIYTYYLRLWALIDDLQAAWNYNWNVQFWIQLQYD